MTIPNYPRIKTLTPEFDYTKVKFILLSGGKLIEIALGSYKEFELSGKKMTFVAKPMDYVVLGDDNYTIVGAVDDVIAMWFLNDEEPTSEPSTS